MLSWRNEVGIHGSNRLDGEGLLSFILEGVRIYPGSTFNSFEKLNSKAKEKVVC